MVLVKFKMAVGGGGGGGGGEDPGTHQHSLPSLKLTLDIHLKLHEVKLISNLRGKKRNENKIM